MADLKFGVAKRRTEPVTFELEGSDHVFTFTPPKQAGMVLPMFEAVTDIDEARPAFEWLDEGLTEEDRAIIYGRLKDKGDDLDIDTIGEVVSGLVEYVSNRPTT
jgi:hypothetical protein